MKQPQQQPDAMPPPATPAPKATGMTGPSPDKMTFSAKKRFFEKEIEESVLPTTKPEKRFSFLNEDEINKLRQEEEKKMATLTSEQLMNLSRLDDVDEEDEDDLKVPEPEAVAVAITVTTVPTAQHPAIVRTAKAEKRMKDKLQREGLELSEEEKLLSPNEQRALQAKKRAAWREARLKSLEQDAMQAELVIKKMNELSDSTSSLRTVDAAATGDVNDNNGNNNQAEVDHSNNNETGPENIAQDRIEEEEEPEGEDQPTTAAVTGTGNGAASNAAGRKKKRSKKTRNR